MIAVQGPQARERVWTVLPAARAASESLKPFNAVQAGEYLIARTGYTGEDGFEIMLPAARAARLLARRRRRRASRPAVSAHATPCAWKRE